MFLLAVGLIVALNGQAQPPNQAAPPRDLRTWYQAYDAGVAAFNKRDWPGAIASLERARQDKSSPGPGRKVFTTGNAFIDYLPDYYLGQAYYNLKQYAQAHDAFNRVKQSNVIRRTDKEYATFNDTATKAGTALFDQQYADVLALLAAGKTAEADTKTMEAKRNAYADDKRLADLSSRISAAASKPAAPTGTTNPPAGGANPTNPPTGGATGANNPPVSYPPASNPPANPTTGANNPPAGRSNPPPAGTTGQPGTTPPTGGGNPRGLQTNQPPTPPPTSPVPAPSIPTYGSSIDPFDEPGIRSFFSGQYEAARDFFTEHMMSPGNSSRDLLYYACSQAALVLTGRADPNTLSIARDRYGQAMMSSKELDADLKLISPKILKLLQAK